jgi:hypothetical protein
MSIRVLRLNHPPPEAEVLPDDDVIGIDEPVSACIEDGEDAADRELCLYRDRTVVLLRRYLRMSLDAGRLPSLLGREFFRTRVTGYLAHTFEDLVIFVHDVEASLDELDGMDQQLIAMIVLQEHGRDEVARMLGHTRRTVVRRYAEALDRVSKIFLRKRIMERFPVTDEAEPISCQEGKSDDFFASDSEHGKYNF